MKRTAGLTFGISLLMLMLILLVAGCTQSSSTPVSTASPTATAAPQETREVTTAPATVVTTPVVNETLKADMVTLVAKMAKQIDKGNVSTVLKEGENTPAFASLLSQIREFKATDSRIAFVYVLEQKNGTATFLVDSDHGTVDAAKCGQEYTDAPAAMKTPVSEPMAVGPYTDHWGTFVSAFAPVDLGSNTSVILVIDTQL